MKKVIIAEKPDMARAFASHLFGNNYEKNKHDFQKGDTIITWSYGHILNMANPEIYDESFKDWQNYPIYPSINTKDWLMTVPKSHVEHFKAIKELLKTANEVIHGGDPDREGQLLIDEILHYCKYKGPVKRLLVSAKDEVSLQRAFNSLDDNSKYKPLYYAGLGRQRADWLIGMNLSRAYTKNASKAGFRETFRIGRVKTPTLMLVVNREQEIKAFKKSLYYTLEGTFKKDGVTFTAQHVPKDAILDPYDRVSDKSLLEPIIDKFNNATASISFIETKNGKTNPPLPHSLDTLQVLANKQFGYSPKDVLKHVQSMYEKAFVTYPRSDCQYIPTSQQADAVTILPMLAKHLNMPMMAAADTSLKSKAFNDDKITAHHAIIPTTKSPSGLSKEEENIYSLIALQYAMQFFLPETFKKTSFEITISNELFKGSGKEIIDLGFKVLLAKNKETNDTNDDTESMVLPILATNDTLEAMSFSIKDRETTPPKRFTEGSLIKAMAEIYKYVDVNNPNKERLKDLKGIGTSATRDTIIEELQQTESHGRKVTPYIIKKGKELIPTAWGELYVSIIDPRLTKPDTTAEMEAMLSDVEHGQANLDDYLNEMIHLIDASISHANTTNYPRPLVTDNEPIIECPYCQKGHLLKKKMKSKDVYFYICSNESCVSPITGKKVFYKASKNGPVLVKCTNCQTLLEERKGKNGLFWACPKCKKTYSDNKGLPNLNAKSQQKG